MSEAERAFGRALESVVSARNALGRVRAHEARRRARGPAVAAVERVLATERHHADEAFAAHLAATEAWLDDERARNAAIANGLQLVTDC